MDTKIILIYCVVSDFLKHLKLHDSESFRMTNAEVITHVVVSAMFFQGNHENTRQFLHSHGYIINMLSKSQLNRRIHQFDEAFWRDLLFTLSQTLHHFENTNEYLVDSFPVSSCDTSRILRSKRYKGKAYHSFSPTRQRYFYGIKVHMLASKNGVPIEVLFTPGSEHDMKSFKRFTLDLPAGSTVYGDRAYNNYEFEDFLKEEAEINLIVERRIHSKRPLAIELNYIRNRMRKRIETVFSEITRLFPRSINAVTSQGFEIKVFSFILAYTFGLFFKKKLALT